MSGEFYPSENRSEELMQIEAFAKINWSLDITGVREDGYHLMDMLMQPVSLADEITLLPARDLRLSTSGYPRIRPDQNNLVMKAALALQSASGCTEGASVHLHKRIPVGAGLGGGSADAAAVLMGLNRLWSLGLSSSELETVGLSVGADVPFCLRGGLTRTGGIGEKLEDHECKSSYWLVIVQPCRGLSTKEVFQKWHASETLVHPDTDAALTALETGDLALLCGSISNILQSVSVELQPEIGEAIQSLKQLGACTALMTGSGSAVFGVFRTGKDARSAADTVRTRWRNAFLCHTQHDSLRVSDE